LLEQAATLLLFYAFIFLKNVLDKNRKKIPVGSEDKNNNQCLQQIIPNLVYFSLSVVSNVY